MLNVDRFLYENLTASEHAELVVISDPPEAQLRDILTLALGAKNNYKVFAEGINKALERMAELPETKEVEGLFDLLVPIQDELDYLTCYHYYTR